MEEEAYEVVSAGIEEVELERVKLEQKERTQNLLYEDIRNLSLPSDTVVDVPSEKEEDILIVITTRPILVTSKTFN